MTTIPFKCWVHDEAQRSGRSPIDIYHRVSSGRYPALSVIRISRGTAFVEVTPWPVGFQPLIPEGYVSLREWMNREARAQHVTRSAIWMRYYRGKYPDLKVTKVSRSVVYVRASQ